MSRIVIAFGGNALGNNPKEQQALIKKAVKNVVPLIKVRKEISRYVPPLGWKDNPDADHKPIAGD